jgi:hypothetical protein
VSPGNSNGLVGDSSRPLSQRQQLLNGPGSTLTAPPAFDSLSHEVGQHRALILPPKRLVERIFDIRWNAKVYGSHRDTLIVEIFNNSMAAIDHGIKIGSNPISTPSGNSGASWQGPKIQGYTQLCDCKTRPSGQLP